MGLAQLLAYLWQHVHCTDVYLRADHYGEDVRTRKAIAEESAGKKGGPVRGSGRQQAG